MIAKYLSEVNVSNRHNIVILHCPVTLMETASAKLREEGLDIIDCGVCLAEKCKTSGANKYLSIELQEYLQEVIGSKAKTIIEGKPKVIGLKNLGILLEPSLELDALAILEKLSQNIALLILWENQILHPVRLHWGVNEEQYNLDFTNITLTKVYAYEV